MTSEPDSPSGEAPRLHALDLLRGLSILAVILLHINIRMRLAGFPFASRFSPSVFHLLFTNGNNGVTVFFALSGFLITSTSIRRFGSLHDVRPIDFYRVRFARIAPLLLAVLLVLAALHMANAPGFHINPGRAKLWEATLAALTFTLNWLEAVRGYLPPNWDVLWSLSVEEAFYLFFPIGCLLLRRPLGSRGFVFMLLAFVAAGPFARTAWTDNEIWREKSYLGGMDAIALGCLTAIFADAMQKSGNLHPVRSRRYLQALQMFGAALLVLIAFWLAGRLCDSSGKLDLTVACWRWAPAPLRFHQRCMVDLHGPGRDPSAGSVETVTRYI